MKGFLIDKELRANCEYSDVPMWFAPNTHSSSFFSFLLFLMQLFHLFFRSLSHLSPSTIKQEATQFCNYLCCLNSIFFLYTVITLKNSRQPKVNQVLNYSVALFTIHIIRNLFRERHQQVQITILFFKLHRFFCLFQQSLLIHFLVSP